MNETARQRTYYDTAMLHMKHYGHKDEVLKRAQEYMRKYKPYQQGYSTDEAHIREAEKKDE